MSSKRVQQKIPSARPNVSAEAVSQAVKMLREINGALKDNPQAISRMTPTQCNILEAQVERIGELSAELATNIRR